MAKLVCSANNKKAGLMPGLEILWWALRDSNPEPRDYEYGPRLIEELWTPKYDHVPISTCCQVCARHPHRGSEIQR